MEVVGFDFNKVIWEVIDDHIAEEENDHDETGLWGFDFNFFGKDEQGVGREGLSAYPYLLMLTKLWPGDWYNKSERMNIMVDEDNGKAVGMVNGRYRKVRRFSRNEFWENIGCLVSAPTFGLGG